MLVYNNFRPFDELYLANHVKDQSIPLDLLVSKGADDPVNFFLDSFENFKSAIILLTRLLIEPRSLKITLLKKYTPKH